MNELENGGLGQTMSILKKGCTVTKARTQKTYHRLTQAEIIIANLTLAYWLDEVQQAEKDKFLETNTRLGWNR